VNHGKISLSNLLSHENLTFIFMVEVTNLKYSGNMLSSDRQDNQINHETNTVVDHVPPSGGSFPVTAVDGVVAVENASQSTPSWDFADSFCSSDTPSENDVSVIIYTAMEQQIALLKSQVKSLRAKNVKKFNVIREQKKVMQDQKKVIEELEIFRDEYGEISKRHFVNTKLLLDQAGMVHELTEELQKVKDVIDQTKIIQELKKLREEADEILERIAMKDKLILDQESQIQKLIEEQRENADTDDVTNKLFDVEEENKKLRNEKSQASLVVKVFLDINMELLDCLAKLPMGSFHSEPSRLFQTPVKGSKVLEIDLLFEFAQAFALRALEGDRNCAVSFLLTRPFVGSDDPVTMKCLDMIRSDPTLLLENDKVHLLSAECIKMVLIHPKKKRHALTLFRVLQKWCVGSKQSRRKVSQDLVQFIALECIDPMELSTAVRSSGFVSDSMICDAYDKQAESNKKAANKDAEAEKKAANTDAEVSKKAANTDAEANRKVTNQDEKRWVLFEPKNAKQAANKDAEANRKAANKDEKRWVFFEPKNAKQAANKDAKANKKAAYKDTEANKKTANKDAEANKKDANKDAEGYLFEQIYAHIYVMKLMWRFGYWLKS
jgi:hypothetical protein